MLSTVSAATLSVPQTVTGLYQLPGAPSGFSNRPPVMPTEGGLGGLILDGLSVSTSLSGLYDSNVTQGSGQAGNSAQDDFILGLGGSVNYQSKASEFTFGGYYRGNYDLYLRESDFSGYSQGAGLSANYAGGPLSVAFGFGVSLDRGSNRNFNSEFVERTNYNTSLTARYKLSAKTSLAGNLGYGYTTASGGNFQDTRSFDLGASALWRYSPLTEFGPGLRYTVRGGDSSQGDRTSIGPTLNVNYQLSTKVSMNSRLGVDFASYEDGGSADPGFAASLGLDWRATKLWGMNLSFFRDTEADPFQAGRFNEVTALRVGYNRKIRRATLNLGMGYETINTEITGNTATSVPDRDYFTLDSSLGMRVLSNTTSASIFLRYSDQDNGAANSWDSVQTGFSLNRSF